MEKEHTNGITAAYIKEISSMELDKGKVNGLQPTGINFKDNIKTTLKMVGESLHGQMVRSTKANSKMTLEMAKVLTDIQVAK